MLGPLAQVSSSRPTNVRLIPSSHDFPFVLLSSRHQPTDTTITPKHAQSPSHLQLLSLASENWCIPLSISPQSHANKEKSCEIPIFEPNTISAPCSVIQTTGRDLRAARNRFFPYPSSPLSIITPTTNLIPLYT
jgi:hypothetical protein